MSTLTTTKPPGGRKLRHFVTDVGPQGPRSGERLLIGDYEPKPTLTGPPEAFWPNDDYSVIVDGDELQVRENTPAGEERLIKTYPAARFASEVLGEYIVIRRIELSAADRDARASHLRDARLAHEAHLVAMNAAARKRWGRQ